MLKRLKDYSLSAKFFLFSLSLLFCNLTLSYFTYREIHQRSLMDEVKEITEQSLSIIHRNMDSLLTSVNNYSKLVLSNSEVQNNFRTGFDHENLNALRGLKSFLSGIINTFPEISAIHMCDFEGNSFSAKSTRQSDLLFNRNRRSSWFERSQLERGSSFFLTDRSDIFLNSSGRDLISCVRSVNDLETQMSLGALVISIRSDLFVNEDLNMAVVDSRNITVADTTEGVFDDYRKSGFLPSPFWSVSSTAVDKTDWTVYLFSEIESVNASFSSLRKLLIYIIVLNSFFLMAGSLIVSRLIVSPLGTLTDVMKGNSPGQFRKASISSSLSEINNLGEGYNSMIDEISTLFHRLAEEERIKREKEWQALQAQIKPHFLYNTFDAVSALALMGRNEDVYSLMSSLGRYYRTCLTDFDETVTLQTELDLVRNYLNILRFRYSDLFELEIDIERELEALQFPKLILQPLVENAVYHGIKPGKRKGLIRIAVSRDGGTLIITVSDNGVGIEPDRLDESLSSGFGLGGTRERLSIFYDRKAELDLRSEKGVGTTVTIWTPIAEGERGRV